ncbi:hypothetical protein CO267_17220 [Acinetobacter baumannii]|uniref:hypothetical protein n=1 Tax=Acinetobacter baumannii TaxID=470 RepID=UPI000BBBEBCE|nr:hypothetical protein [Acinetobacter baumannii]PCE44612.1 hypothetical protein CO267_17220 [Acinetobacter baumannii]
MSITPQLFFDNKRLESFEINQYIAKKNLLSMFFVVRNISKGMGTTFKSILKKSYSLDDAVLAISNYSQNMTAGKVQIIVDDAIGG